MNLSDPQDLASLLEAFLLAAGRPLSLERMAELFEEAERPEPALLRQALEILRQSCEGRAFELKEVASGFRLQVREQFAPWVGRLWDERPQRYSRAMLETLALIAYRQPITRGEIEDIRGVAVNSQIVKTLLEREWIRVVGHRDVPGKPEMFATTRVFLDYFNLKGLEELPTLAALRDLEPEPLLAFTDELSAVEAAVQASVAAAEKPREELNFRSLLAELDTMEEGLKTDFDDLPVADEDAAPAAEDAPVEGAPEHH
ncbi:SMC-Scp complex subunit ScpB [Pseudomonas sp. N040]|uniref:SMC-Scp complex subunit ScpB n=1 Tax=Pseudomonas sp. N040 TaxID=2785325 RepID=UPI0018A2918D|nr:SMC-Scp complex subunit ScpB [Pseudomonas sp. N040]MBF7729507.1 SMC-Scp complex subunit ScpB [Pseudomonas sp. N040]MBW7013147.1 SMC-Scp complex subunit ScpB [Pseudomonas sp. N040]